MNTVTIKLGLEKGESQDKTLANFHENLSELLHNDIDYEPEGIVNSSKNEVFIGIKLSDNDLKNVIDAAPGNTFEVVDVHWPKFLEDKLDEGYETVEIRHATN